MARNYSRGYNNKGNYPKSKKGRWRFLLKIVYASLFISIIGSGAYFLFFSSVFKIKEISVKGNDYIIDAAIISSFNNVMSEKKWLILENDNINLFDLAAAKQKIIEEFPRIDALDLKKEYPDKITVNIKERKIADILCLDNDTNNDSQISKYDFSKCFFVDNNGIAFDVAADTQGFLILRIWDKRGQDIELNKKALNPEFIDFVRQIKDDFRSTINANIKLLVLEHPAQRELIALVDDWKIIFNVSSDAKNQLAVLKQVLEKEIKDKKNNLDYIDLRIDGRAYYKLDD